MLTFVLPAQLRALAGGRKTIAVDAATLSQAFGRLEDIAPLVRSRVFDEAGALRQFVALFVDNQRVSFDSEDRTVLRDGSEIVIVMAIAGG